MVLTCSALIHRLELARARLLGRQRRKHLDLLLLRRGAAADLLPERDVLLDDKLVLCERARLVAGEEEEEEEEEEDVHRA